jgi:hypothetical protein
MVVHTSNPSTVETETGGLQVLGQPQLHSKFQARLTEAICDTLSQKTKQNKKKQKRR